MDTALTRGERWADIRSEEFRVARPSTFNRWWGEPRIRLPHPSKITGTTLTTLEEIEREIRYCIGERRALIDTDKIERDLRAALLAELGALERRLLDVAPTFLALAERHKLRDVTPLVEILVDGRCRQMILDVRVFKKWNTRKLASLPKKLAEARAFLDDASPLLSQVFTLGLVEAVRFARTYRSPETATVPREPRFAGDGRSLSDIRIAVRVLDHALGLVNTLDWRSWFDECSRPIFGPGPRRNQAHEAATARKLIALFKAETGKELDDYVGTLLAATFPAAESGSACKRPRDYVRQLRQKYPATPGEQSLHRKVPKTRRKKRDLGM